MASTRNLRITSCNEVYRGNGAKGEYVIYEVEAVDATTGVLVNVPLRSFSHLTEGQAATFNVDKYERPGKETTYTLSLPKGSGGGNSLGPKVDDLRKRIELLESNYDILKRAVAALEAQGQQAAPPVAAGGSIHSGGGGTPPATTDDDIPF